MLLSTLLHLLLLWADSVILGAGPHLNHLSQFWGPSHYHQVRVNQISHILCRATMTILFSLILDIPLENITISAFQRAGTFP